MTRRTGPVGAELLGGDVFDRQVNNEARARPGFTFDLDKTAVVVDHTVNDGKAKTGAFAALLRGEERLEDVRLHLPAHSDAGVAHANARVAIGGDAGEHFRKIGAGRDGSEERKGAAVRHGVARIHAKIQQDLMDLALVGRDQGKVRLQFQIETDRLGKSCLQHWLQLTNERIQIDGRKTRFGLAS